MVRIHIFGGYVCLSNLAVICTWDLSYYNVANGGFLTKPSGEIIVHVSVTEVFIFVYFKNSLLMRGPRLTTRTGCVTSLLDMVIPHLCSHGNFSMRYLLPCMNFLWYSTFLAIQRPSRLSASL